MRLTHKADFGFEDWEETLFLVKSDPNGAYNILDIARFQGEPEFDEALKSIALRLAAYENTGLEPEDIKCPKPRRIEACEGCTWQHLDGDDYPCALCNRNPHLTDRYKKEEEE